MKNAQYEKKLKKLLSEAGKCSPPSPVSGMQLLRTMIEGILQIETTARQSSKAISAIEKEFVDYNELRSSAGRDIIECLGRDFPLAREKADMLIRVLTRVFEKASDISADYMLKMSRRDLQEHLEETGMSPFASAYVLLEGFGGHSVPVDPALVECLEIEQCIKPGMEVQQVQSLLERLTPAKGARAVHRLMRDFVEKSAKPLQKRRAEAAAKAALLAAEQAAAQERAAAKARAKQEQAEKLRIEQEAKAAAAKAAAAKSAKAKHLQAKKAEQKPQPAKKPQPKALKPAPKKHSKPAVKSGGSKKKK